MRAVSFCRCECGIEMKLLQELDDTTQAYTCRCGREFEFLGTIVEIYTAKGNARLTTSLDWTQVPKVSQKASV
jgi:hypothetical protein